MKLGAQYSGSVAAKRVIYAIKQDSNDNRFLLNHVHCQSLSGLDEKFNKTGQHSRLFPTISADRRLYFSGLLQPVVQMLNNYVNQYTVDAG